MQGIIEVNKEKHFLITTALEETWVEDQPVLFLGEWCRPSGMGAGQHFAPGFRGSVHPVGRHATMTNDPEFDRAE